MKMMLGRCCAMGVLRPGRARECRTIVCSHHPSSLPSRMPAPRLRQPQPPTQRPSPGGCRAAAGSRSPSSARSGRRWPRAAAACCTPPPAPARPTRSGSACSSALLRAASRRRAAPSRCACSGSRRCARWPPTRTRALHGAAARPRRRPGRIGLRTGDTPLGRARAAGPAPAHRAGHHARVADADAHARARARGARHASQYVIVDEWHELMGSKRGVQVQLALARLRALEPGPGRLGPVRDAGQPRARRCTCCCGAGAEPAPRWCAAASTRRSSSTR